MKYDDTFKTRISCVSTQYDMFRVRTPPEPELPEMLEPVRWLPPMMANGALPESAAIVGAGFEMLGSELIQNQWRKQYLAPGSCIFTTPTSSGLRLVLAYVLAYTKLPADARGDFDIKVTLLTEAVGFIKQRELAAFLRK